MVVHYCISIPSVSHTYRQWFPHTHVVVLVCCVALSVSMVTGEHSVGDVVGRVERVMYVVVRVDL